jgi:hypothetical protein
MPSDPARGNRTVFVRWRVAGPATPSRLATDCGSTESSNEESTRFGLHSIWRRQASALRSSAVIAGKSSPVFRSICCVSGDGWYSIGGPNLRHGSESRKLTRRSSGSPGHLPPLRADLEGVASLFGRWQVELRLLLLVRSSRLDSLLMVHCKLEDSWVSSAILETVCLSAMRKMRSCRSQRVDHGEAGTKQHRHREDRTVRFLHLLESVFEKCEFYFREFGCLKLGSLSWYICSRQTSRIATGL